MDKRNESIYKQIIQLTDKVILYDLTFNKLNLSDVNTITDQQELFKLLSDENKKLKNILSKITKLCELINNINKINDENNIENEKIELNLYNNINLLDENILSLNNIHTNLLDSIKQKNTVEIIEELEPIIVIPTLTNMEELKRAFFNKEYEQFQQLIKIHDFTYYNAEYKFSSDNDNKPEYIAKNLVGGRFFCYFLLQIDTFCSYIVIISNIL